MHYCEDCLHPIHDIRSPNSVRLVEAWVAGDAKTYLKIEQERFRYFHKVCWDTKARHQTESLF